MQCKTATMIGDLYPSENQESIVLITDIDSSLYDYKLMKLQNGNVNLVKTQVHIAIRFFKASNDDINEKKEVVWLREGYSISKRNQAVFDLTKDFLSDQTAFDVANGPLLLPHKLATISSPQVPTPPL